MARSTTPTIHILSGIFYGPYCGFLGIACGVNILYSIAHRSNYGAKVTITIRIGIRHCIICCISFAQQHRTRILYDLHTIGIL